MTNIFQETRDWIKCHAAEDTALKTYQKREWIEQLERTAISAVDLLEKQEAANDHTNKPESTN